MSLRDGRDEIPKFFDNLIMSGRCGGYLGYDADRTVRRFQQCPCVVEQEEIFFGTDDDQYVGGFHEIAIDKHADVAIAAGDKHLRLVFQQSAGIKPGFGCFEAFEIAVVKGRAVAVGLDIVRRVAHGDARTDQQEIESFVIDDVADILPGVVLHLVAGMDVHT